MKNKILTALLSVCAVAATHTTQAQGFIGNGTSNGIKAVNSSGSLSGVNVGIGVAAPAAGTTLEVADPGAGTLGLKLDNLPSITTPYVLYYDGSSNVTYGAAPGGSISSLNYDCGVGTFTVNGVTSAAKAWLLSGATTSGSSDYLGTYNDDDIRIATNNSACGLNTLKQKMIIGSETNHGNISIGWDGVTAPPIASTNSKVLVQNGAVSTTPYSAISGLGIPGSDIGIYSYANNTAGGTNNVSVAAVAEAAQSMNVGYVGLISNGTNLNAGMFMGVNTSAATANNIGVSVDLVGSGAAGNLGFNASVTGDNSVNNGIRVRLDGNNGDNTGMGLDVGTTSSTTNTNKGIDVNVTGSSVSNNGITSNATGAANFLNSAISGHADGATWTNYNNPQGNIGVWGDAKSGTGVSNTVNTAVKGDANGDGSYNSSFMGDASGNTNTLNVGLAQNCHGNSNNSWSGPGSYLTGWQANVGSFASVFGQSSVNIGGMAEIIDGGTDNTGSEVYGLIGSSVANGCHSQVGVWGYLGNAPANSIANYAVRGTAPGGAGGGVFGPTNGTSPVAPSYAGYFEGDVFATNTYYYSDPKLKTNISEYKGAMDLLGKLAIKRYTFRTEEYPYMNLPQGEQVGVLSSDLKKVCPGLVKPAVHLSTRKGDAQVSFEAVNYNALIPVLVQAVKEVNDKADNPELAKKVADQQNLINVQAQLLADQGRQIADLRNMLDDLCTNGCAGFSPRGNTTMPAAQSAVLYQSVPNPASGTVTIGYAINMPYSAASIKVVTIDDKLISEYKINGQGSGSISFDTNNMAAGVYKYYLSIDGKIADAKSMSVSNK